MSETTQPCPKCGGEMKRGRVRYTTEQTSGSPMMGMADFPMRGIDRMSQSVTSSVFWEEKTGAKTGLIFKRDETKRMELHGLRCTICGYIELYAQE
ncbi:MAG: PF20097 family protein [Candidatus Bathyarchaeota archaeon]|jgi:predicted nucleic-acid-binding Zn-ribbon protein|nr:PF20097 family protein [Candidatus Bathyarchaeota archaeon]